MAGLGQGMNAMKSMGGNWKRPMRTGTAVTSGTRGTAEDSRRHRDRRRCHSHRMPPHKGR